MLIGPHFDLKLHVAVSEAHKYFVEFISKAYQALTDPISRENFEKYGHPDGRQVVNSLIHGFLPCTLDFLSFMHYWALLHDN